MMYVYTCFFYAGVANTRDKNLNTEMLEIKIIIYLHFIEHCPDFKMVMF